MKNPVKALAVISFMAATFLSTTSAIVPEKTTIKKIILRGNARVVLVQREIEEIVIQDNFTGQGTSVSEEGLSLIIKSQESTPLNITIYARAPFRIEAFNSVSVETRGNFDLQYLQVFLHDRAVARITSKTTGLYTTVNHSAKLTLAGSSEDHVSVRSIGSRIQTADLACLKTNTSYFVPATYSRKLTAKNVAR